MKKGHITIAIALLFLLSSCASLDKFTQFDMSFSQDVSIEPPFDFFTPINIATPPITTNSSTTFSSNNTNKDLVDEITLKEVKLTVISPTGEDFSILKSIEVYISAEGETRTKIAELDNVPINESTITLNVSEDANLKNFIFKDEFKLEVETVTKETFTKQYDIKIDTKVHVNAKILGI